MIHFQSHSNDTGSVAQTMFTVHLSPFTCQSVAWKKGLCPKTECRGVGWGFEGSRLEAWMKSHKSDVAVT